MRTGTMLLRLTAILLFAFALLGGVLSLASTTLATAALIFIGGITAGGILWALAEGLEILRRIEANSRRDAPALVPFASVAPALPSPAVEPAPPERIPAALPFPVKPSPDLLETQPALPAIETQPVELGIANPVPETTSLPAAAAVFEMEAAADQAATVALPRMGQGHRIIFVLGLVLLLVGQAWASVIHWLNLPLSTFESLDPISCGVFPCGLHLPAYFNLVLPLLGVAIILLGWALRPTALRVTRDVVWQTLEPIRKVGQLREVAWGSAVISLVASIVAAASALTSPDGYPPVPLWALPVLLWGITFYLFDRAYHRTMPFSRRALFNLLAYTLLLFVLLFVYHIPIMDSWVVRLVFVVLAGLIVAGMWREGYLSGVSAALALVAIVGMAVYTYNATSWRYSFLGDEYAYYETSFNFFDYLNNGGTILSSTGVYLANPIFGSYLQAVIMNLYGKDIYSWRAGSAVFVFLTAPAVFSIARRIRGTKTGLLAVVIFVSSHYLIGLTRVGYVQPQLLPVFAAMMAFALHALEHRSTLAVYLSGAAGAFSFYTFILGFPLIPIPLLMLTIWVFLPTRELVFRRRLMIGVLLGVVFFVGLWAVAYPRVLKTNWIDEAGYVTILQPERKDLTNPFLEQSVPNALYTLGSTLYFDVNSHYTSGAHLDPLSSVLMLAGIAGMISVATRRRTALWLLLSFFASVAVAGGFTPYTYPNHTRPYLLEIFYAIFAAVGAAYLWNSVQEFGWRSAGRWVRVALAATVVAVVALNLYQFFILSEGDLPKSAMALLMQQLEETSPETTIYLASEAPNDGTITTVIASYGYPPSRMQPIMNRQPLEALTEIRNNTPAPYRVVIWRDAPDVEAWYAAARAVWPDRELQTIYDDADLQFITVVDVPQ